MSSFTKHLCILQFRRPDAVSVKREAKGIKGGRTKVVIYIYYQSLQSKLYQQIDIFEYNLLVFIVAIVGEKQFIVEMCSI